MPTPVSTTSTRTPSAGAVARMVIVPVGVNLTAFEIEVDDDLDEPIAIAADGRAGRRPSSTTEAAVRHRAPSSDAVAAVARLDDLADVDHVVAPLHPAGLDLGQVEGVVDERGQPLTLLDDDGQVLGDLAHRPLDLGIARRHGREDDLRQPLAR